MKNGGQNGHIATRVLVITLLILVCVLFVAYKYRAAVYAEMNTLKLVPEPERFTELYFTNPAAIPTSTIAGQPMSFAFTIQNLQGVTTTYPYTAYFKNPAGQTIPLARGIVSLADNASTSIPVLYTFPTSTTDGSITGEVVVALPTLNNQRIDFLLPYNN